MKDVKIQFTDFLRRMIMNLFYFLRPIIFINLFSLLLVGCGGTNTGTGSDTGDAASGGRGGNGSSGDGGDSTESISNLAIESGNYRRNNNIDLTVTFLAPVIVSTNNNDVPSIGLTIGDQTRQAVYFSGSGDRSVVFRYSVGPADQDIDGIEVAEEISLNGSEITYSIVADLSSLESRSVLLDLQLPSNLSSVKVLNGGILGLSDPLHVQSNTHLNIPVSFSEDVMVDETRGTPEIAINVSGSSQRAVYESGSGSDTLIFRYAVPPNQRDGAVVLLGTIDFRGGSITYSADDVEVVAKMAPSANPNVVVRVDNTAPTIQIGQAASVTGGNYVTGTSVDIGIPFNEDMLVSGTGSRPSISLNVGGTPVTAFYESGSGQNTLVFRYTVQSGHSTGDDPITLTPIIETNDWDITDRAGNTPSSFVFSAPTNLASISIDGSIPSITSIDIPSDYYRAGDVINITLNISENVNVNDAEGTPYIELRIGNTSRNASYISGSGTMMLGFSYTIQDGENSDDISLPSLHLNGGTIQDSNGNNLITSFTPPANLEEVIVDTTIPTINSVVIADGVYSTLNISVHFSEPVNVDTSGGTNIPHIPLILGLDNKEASYVSGSGEDTLIFRYIVEDGISAAGGINMTSPLELNSGSVTDLAGHALADLSFSIPTNLASVLVDTTDPVINAVTIPAQTYAGGGRINLSVAFSELVTVDIQNGRPQISLDVGEAEVFASYTSGGGSDTLIFEYIVEMGQFDDSGIGVVSPLLLNNGTIRDMAGNSAVLDFSLPDNLDNVLVDATAPAVNTATVADGNYAYGSSIDITVTFDKSVSVTGRPAIPLRVGFIDRLAEYVPAGAASSSLIFRYTLVEGERDSDGINITTPIDLRGGSISDALGNMATDLSFNVPLNLAAVQVDSHLPTVSRVVISDGTYGGAVDFQVIFSEEVNVTGGRPFIVLDVSGVSKNAVFESGSGERTLIFRYNVEAGDNDQDGIGMTPDLNLNGASITDLFGNALTDRSFSIPSNLGDVNVDNTVTSIDAVTVDAGSYKVGDNIDIDVQFNRAITVTGAPSIGINVGGTTRSAVYNATATAASSGTNNLIFRYTVVPAENAARGIGMNNVINLNEGTILNNQNRPPSSLNFTRPTNLASVKVDTIPPSINSVTVADGTYGENMDISVVFSESVNIEGTGIPSISLTIGTENRVATYESGSGNDTLIFRYSVGQDEMDGDGIGMGSSIELNGVSIVDAAGNTPSNATASSLSFAAPSNLESVFIDSVQPSLVSVTIPDGTYGGNLDISANFNENVIVNTDGGTPSISLTIGGQSRTAVYHSGSGEDTLIFRYSIRSYEIDSRGINMGTAIDLNSGIVTDVGGNLPIGATENSLAFTPPSNLSAVFIDGIVPTITSINVNDGIYRGEMDIRLVFSEPVIVGGSGMPPSISLRVGQDNSKRAVYVSGSGGTTLLFRYNVVSGDLDTDGIEMISPIELNGSTIVDVASNAPNFNFEPPLNLGSVKVDRVHPTIDNATVAARSYLVGQNVDIAVNFDEALNVITTNGTPKISLTVGNDPKDAFYDATASRHDRLIFRYTVMEGDLAENGINMISSIDLNGGLIEDLAGNVLATTTFSTPSLSQVQVDGIIPTIRSVTIAPGNYRIGQHLAVSVNFDETIVVDESGGRPKLSLFVGGNRRDAFYDAASSERMRLVFRYTVVSEDNDTDGIAITSPIDLNGGTIRDMAGYNAILGFTPPPSFQVFVDTIVPSIEDVEIASGNYRAGQHVDIRVYLSEYVAVEGSAEISLDLNGTTRTASYLRGSGSASLLFRYTVADGDNDLNGVGLSTSITLGSGGSISDYAGNIVSNLNFTMPSNLSSVKIDTTAPTISSLSVPDGTHGGVVDFTMVFSEIVRVDPNLPTPSILINIAEAVKTATYVGGSGTNSLVFRYTVAQGETDTNGIHIAGTLDVGGESITDIFGNALSGRSFSIPNNIGNVVVDNSMFSISEVSIDSGTYKEGENINIVVEFNRRAVVQHSADRPFIEINVGGNTKRAFYASHSNSTVTFAYRVASGENDEDGIGMTSSINRNGASIYFHGGNSSSPRNLNFTVPVNLALVKVDTTSPTINSVSIDNGTYNENLDLSVVFSEEVFVRGTGVAPSISLTIGNESRMAVYESGSGSDTLIFRYPIVAAESASGIQMGSSIDLGGRTITDVGGNATSLSFSVPSNIGSVNVDRSGPRIDSVTVAARNYRVRDYLDITLNFNEVVNVVMAGGRIPIIPFSLRQLRREALFYSGSGSNTLIFRYIVSPGDIDDDGIALRSYIELNGGKIKDRAGNDTTLTFTPPDTAQVIVDGLGPAITAVSIASGEYRAGQYLDVTANFDETVSVTGTPVISLNIGGVIRNASYLNGSGSQHTFRYTVVAGDNDLDGVSILTPINLEGGNISDSLSNTARDLSFTALLNVDSVVVDTALPEIRSVMVASGTYGGIVDFTMLFNEEVNVSSGTPSLSIDVGGTTKNATYLSTRGRELIFRYNVEAGEMDTDGIGMTSALNLNGASITDTFGNALIENSFRVPANLGSVHIDATRTTITAVTATDGNYKVGENIDIIVGFNKNVAVTGSPNIILNIGGNNRNAVYNQTASGTTSLAFRYTVVSGDNDEDGIQLTPSINLNQGTILDNVNNNPPASLDFIPPLNLSSVKVDSTIPTVDSISVADGTYGGHIDFTVVFSETVSVGGSGIPNIPLTVGSENRTAEYFSVSESHPHALIFRYVVGADESASGIQIGSSIDLNNGAILDTAGNAPANLNLTAPSNLNTVIVDGVDPTIRSITINDGTYSGNMDFSVTFSEIVQVDDENGTPSISLSVDGENRMASYASGSGSNTLIFRYIVQPGERDTDGIEVTSPLVLNEGSIVDAGGNAASLTFTSPVSLTAVVVDRDLPIIDSVVIEDGIYGGRMNINVVFSEPVTVGGTGSPPSIPLMVGGASRSATYVAVSEDNPNTLIFRYTIRSRDRDIDTDGIQMGSALDLGDRTITDAGGNAPRSLGLPAPPNLTSVTVDGIDPIINSVVVVPRTYITGEHFDITVNFNEAVNVVTTGGIPKIAIGVGQRLRNAFFEESISTRDTLVFRYTVLGGEQGDNDNDGISMTSSIHLNGGSIEDLAGNGAILSFSSPDASQIFFDTVAPSINSVRTVASGIYKANEHLDINLTFNEMVNLVTLGGSRPKISLTIGQGAMKYAFYEATNSTERNLVFRYTVVDGDNDDDGITIANSVDLNGAIIRDTAGNNISTLTFTEMDTSQVFVDTSSPSINSVTIAAGSYKAGDRIDIPFVFSETTIVSAVSSGPKVVLMVGANRRDAVYRTRLVPNTPIFSYTVVEGDTNGNVLSLVSPIILGGGSIRDNADNRATSLSFTPPDLSEIIIDTVAPTIQSVTVTPWDYITGDDLDIVVNFSENVIVDETGGTPGITLNVNGAVRSANYVSGSESRSLTFRYTLVSRDVDRDGIGMTSPFLTNGGTVRDAVGNDASRTFTLPNLSRVIFNHDTTGPQVTGVTIPSQLYRSSSQVPIFVDFNEVVVVTLQQELKPFISIVVDEVNKKAFYSSGAGTSQLTFLYTVGQNDKDLDGVELSNQISLNSATLADSSGHSANLNFTAPSFPDVIIGGTVAEYKGLNLFRGLYLGGYTKAAWVDVNGDDQEDFVIGTEDGKLKYYQATDEFFEEKTGSNNPFNGINVGERSAPAFGNIDGDSDLELVIGSRDGFLRLYDKVNGTWTEKTGSNNPWSGANVGSYTNPTFTRLDGNLSLVVGSSNGLIHSFGLTVSDSNNDGTDDSWRWNRLNTNLGSAPNGDSAPTFANLDNDNDLELVVGDSRGNLKYYDKVGRIWTEKTGDQNPFNDINVGKDVAPVFANIDDDDQLELVIGENLGVLNYCDLVGTEWVLASDSKNPFTNFNVGRYAQPTFANLDTDDRVEMVIGHQDGTLKYYDWQEDGWTELTGSDNPFNGIDVGSNSAPVFANLDTEPTLELLIGHRHNGFKYYDYINGAWTEQTGNANPFGSLSGVGGYLVPFFANFDSDADLELVFGSWRGFDYYDKTSTGWSTVTSSNNPISLGQSVYNTAPAGADINNDGTVELVVGQDNGTFMYASLSNSKWIGQTGSSNIFGDIDAGDYSAPTFGNLDHDSDLEIVIGNSFGRSLIYGDNYGGTWVYFR